MRINRQSVIATILCSSLISIVKGCQYKENSDDCKLQAESHFLESWDGNPSDDVITARDAMTDSPKAEVTSLALVPYDENKILPHEKSERSFAIAGHEFCIEQNWQDLGVAAVVWDSAIVLAEYMSENSELVAGKKVLELGAGTGLAGMVAAALGASVTVTERAEAMQHLTATVKNNTAGKDWQITAQVLDWTDNPTPPKFSGYDVVMGADIIYIEETFSDLLRTLIAVTTLQEADRSHFRQCAETSECESENQAHSEEDSSSRNSMGENSPDSKYKKSKTLLLSCRIRYDRDMRFLNLLREQFIVDEVFYEKARGIKIFSAYRKS